MLTIIPIVGVMKGDLSNYRLFVPRPFVTKNERSLWGIFITRTFHSRELSFLRTFVPGNFKSSRERKFPIGTFRSWEQKVLGTSSQKWAKVWVPIC